MPLAPKTTQRDGADPPEADAKETDNVESGLSKEITSFLTHPCAVCSYTDRSPLLRPASRPEAFSSRSKAFSPKGIPPAGGTNPLSSSRVSSKNERTASPRTGRGARASGFFPPGSAPPLR